MSVFMFVIQSLGSGDLLVNKWFSDNLIMFSFQLMIAISIVKFPVRYLTCSSVIRRFHVDYKKEEFLEIPINKV